MLKLRKHQAKCASNIRDAYEDGVYNQLVKMPTGTGKTPLFAELANFLGFKGRVLVIAHRENLVIQAHKQCAKWNPGAAIGFEMGDLYAGDARFVIASIQTIGRKGSPRLLQFDPSEFDLIIVDEAHHAVTTAYQSVFDYFDAGRNRSKGSKILHLGVTATPNRADGIGLSKVYEEIVFDMDMLQAAKDGWIVWPLGKRIDTNVSLDWVRSTKDDLNLEDLGKAVNVDTRNLLAVQAWKEYGEGRQTLAFTVDIAHAKALAELFVKNGIKAEAVWGDDPDKKSKLDRHRSKETTILVNCQLLTEGYDDWQIGCILLCRPTSSEVLYTQIIGRGTRLQDGIDNLNEAIAAGLEVLKRDCIVIDLVDSSDKHSLVSISSLYGLGGMDLEKRSLFEVLEIVEKLKQNDPKLDIESSENIEDLIAYAKEVDLFRYKVPPEIVQISPTAWFRKPHDPSNPWPHYEVKMPNNSNLVVMEQENGWHLRGRINGDLVENKAPFPDLRSAIEEGDYNIKIRGGKEFVQLVAREAKWKEKKPQPKQLELASKLGIKVPPGINSGELANITQNEINKRRKYRQKNKEKLAS